MKLIHFLLLYQLLLLSCKEKNNEYEKADLKAFIESSDKALQSNSYFGISGSKLSIPINDTTILVEHKEKKIKYAYITYKLLFNDKRSNLNIEFYGNLNKKEMEFLEGSFMIEKKLEGISCMIKMNDFFCKAWLTDELPSSVSYLQNVRITLLENYISQMSLPGE